VIRLSLIGVRVEVPTNQPIVLLREEDGTRFLPIFIGSPEATAIVYALQGLATPRPLTHDLFQERPRRSLCETRPGGDHQPCTKARSTPRSSSIATGPSPASRLGRRMRSPSRSASAPTSRSSPTKRCSTRPACSSRPTTRSKKSPSSVSSSTRSLPKTSPSSSSWA